MDDNQRRQRLRTLTLEQRVIFTLLCQRKSRREIAALRAMTVPGVDYHCTQIARKLGLQEGAGRRNALDFRLALLEFLPFLLELAEEQIPPTLEAAAEEAPEAGEAPAADPAVLALVDQMTAPALRRPGTVVPWAPPAAGGGPGGPGPTARQVIRRWWRPLAFLLVLALAAGVAGGVVAAHVIGGGTPVPALIASTSTDGATTSVVALLSPSSTGPPRPASPAPQAPTAAQTPPAVSSASTSIATAAPSLAATTSQPVDLAGRVASDFPGTPLTLGDAISSIIDEQTKPRDVYRVQLTAGQRLQVSVAASADAYTVALDEPGTLPGSTAGVALCDYLRSCSVTVPIAATATYRLVLTAAGTGIRYTLHPEALPPSSAPGERNLAGTVASDLPGTPLDLGATVIAIIDAQTKPVDVYTLVLTAGQTLTVNVTANSSDYRVLLAPPGTAPFAGHLDAVHGTSLCDYLHSCQQRFSVASSGTYALVVAADGAGVEYTLHTTVA